ncbi:MAG: hypothetical protein ACI9EW_001904 [Cellvibrionaceae bacterium]|jgi:hypothetical protein
MIFFVEHNSVGVKGAGQAVAPKNLFSSRPLLTSHGSKQP